MKSDIRGFSTCPIGGEQYEYFQFGRFNCVQYDYRDVDGRLFSTIEKTLETAREKRDAWRIRRRNANELGKEVDSVNFFDFGKEVRIGKAHPEKGETICQ